MPRVVYEVDYAVIEEMLGELHRRIDEVVWDVEHQLSQVVVLADLAKVDSMHHVLREELVHGSRYVLTEAGAEALGPPASEDRNSA